MIDNFIWSGGSLGSGVGFGKCGVNLQHATESTPYPFHLEELKKGFNPPYTFSNIRNQIYSRTFPVLLGNKLGAKNIKNLSQGGMGIETHIRTLMSYIINNLESIDLEKTIVMLDSTDVTRVELPLADRYPIIDFLLSPIHNKEAALFFDNFFNIDHRLMNSLVHLLSFKGWCESMGITFYFCHFGHDYLNEFMEKTENVDINRTTINLPDNTWEPITYPNIKTIVDKIGVINIEIPIEYTFAGAGYHDDNHFTLTGHEYFSNVIYNKINEKNTNIRR